MITTNSARDAIRIATRSGWKAQELQRLPSGSGHRDTTPQILHGLDCGRILKLMEKAKEPVRAWLKVAYATEGWATDADRVRVHEALINEYHRRRTVRQPGKVANLAIAVITDYRQRSISAGTVGMSRAELCRRARIDARNWDKGWAENYAELVAILNDWDAVGLGPIKKQLRDWCESARCEDMQLQAA